MTGRVEPRSQSKQTEKFAAGPFVARALPQARYKSPPAPSVAATAGRANFEEIA